MQWYRIKTALLVDGFGVSCMQKGLLLVAALVPALLAGPRVQAEEQYKFKLNRPFKAGIYAYFGSRNETLEQTYFNGSTERNEEMRFLVEGTLKMTGRNKPNTTYGWLYLRTCMLGGESLLPKGAPLEIIIMPDRSLCIKYKGKPIAADTAKLIQSVMPIEEGTKGQASADILYNPWTSQPVGGSWNTSTLKFTRTHPGVVPNSTKSRGRLVSVTKINDEDCLDVQVDVTYKLKEGAVEKDCAQSYVWILPVALDGPVYKEEDRLVVKFTEDDVQNVRKTSRSYQIIPKAAVGTGSGPPPASTPAATPPATPPASTPSPSDETPATNAPEGPGGTNP